MTMINDIDYAFLEMSEVYVPVQHESNNITNKNFPVSCAQPVTEPGSAVQLRTRPGHITHGEGGIILATGTTPGSLDQSRTASNEGKDMWNLHPIRWQLGSVLSKIVWQL